MQMSFWSRREPTTTGGLACSFCGKPQADVLKLIAGPSVYICDECVRLSADIVDGELGPATVPPPPPTAAVLAAHMGERVVGHRALVHLLSRLVAGNSTRTGRAPSVLLVGPSGSGKTALCRALAAHCGVPVAHTHAHRITATGYIGADLENVVQQVVMDAAGDLVRASRGLLILEDLHHLVLHRPSSAQVLDVGGAAVLPHLARLLDGRPLFLPADPAQAVHPQTPTEAFNPEGLVCVFSCQLADPAPSDAELRAQLLTMGLTQDLLSRVDLVVRVPPRGAAELAQVVDQLVSEVEASTGVRPTVSGANRDAMVAAAQGPSGAWAARQRLIQLALGVDEL